MSETKCTCTLSTITLTRDALELHFAEMIRPKSVMLPRKYRGPTCCFASLYIATNHNLSVSTRDEQ